MVTVARNLSVSMAITAMFEPFPDKHAHPLQMMNVIAMKYQNLLSATREAVRLYSDEQTAFAWQTTRNVVDALNRGNTCLPIVTIANQLGRAEMLMEGLKALQEDPKQLNNQFYVEAFVDLLWQVAGGKPNRFRS